MQQRIADPAHKLPKTYWVQVEGVPTTEALHHLAQGVNLGDFVTRPAEVRSIEPPALWPRNPPIRVRQTVPDSWLELTIREGKNRQVRRMTANVGLPTLRLIRVRIGDWQLDGLLPGELRRINVPLPQAATMASQPRREFRSRPSQTRGKR